MSSLVEKIRRAREARVEAGGHVFVVRRPTDLEMLAFYQAKDPAHLLRFVVGWESVREMDLIPGGDPHPAPFDADACAEWMADRMDLFGPVTDAILRAYEAHSKALEDAEKNS